MAVTVKFHDKVFIQGLEKATATGLIRAGQFYHSATRRAVSVPNTGRRKTRKRNTSRGPKGSSYTVYPGPSKPGQPPRLQTGHGRANIVFQFSGWNSHDPWTRVGVTRNALYMFFHEVGINGVKRPWMIPTLLKHADQIGQLAVTTTKRAMPGNGRNP